ncbi:MAG: CPBP family intramembrane metalloprotease [Clostridia bacterium]|nr:CPBP family intramembrane metalloprotease [Clostridia bacterium]
MYNAIDPAKIEKRNILKHSNIMGIAVVGVSVLSLPLSALVIFLCNLLFSVSPLKLSTLMQTDIVVAYAINAVITLFVFTVPFVIFAKVLKCKISEEGLFGKPFKGSAPFLCVLFGMGMTFAGNFATGIFAIITKVLFGVEPIEPQLGVSDNSILSIVIEVLLVAAIPALIEEFAFRGVLLAVFKRFGNWPAIIVTTVLFAFMHCNFVQIPFALFAGFAFGVITVATKSIWPAVIVHFLNNSLAVLSQHMADYIFGALFYLIIIVGIIAFVFLIKKETFKNLKPDVPSCLKVSQRTIKLLFSPVMAVAIVLFVIASLFMFQTV